MDYKTLTEKELTAVHVFHHNETTLTVPALILQYIGSNTYGNVVVDASTGDVTFYSDDVDGATTVDTTVVATTGKLDVSDALYDTFGECADIINASANWRCMLVGVRRSDSSNNTLAVLANTSAKVSTQSGSYNSAGLPLYLDEAVSFKCGYSITNKKYTGITAGSANKKGDETDEGYQNELWYQAFKSTYASGTSVYSVYMIDDTTNTEVLIASGAGGATTVAGTLAYEVTYGIPVKVPIGKRIFVQLVNSAAMVVTQATLMGRTVKRGVA